MAVADGSDGEKRSEGREREYCERESENERERVHEIPKGAFGWRSGKTGR